MNRTSKFANREKKKNTLDAYHHLVLGKYKFTRLKLSRIILVYRKQTHAWLSLCARALVSRENSSIHRKNLQFDINFTVFDAPKEARVIIFSLISKVLRIFNLDWKTRNVCGERYASFFFFFQTTVPPWFYYDWKSFECIWIKLHVEREFYCSFLHVLSFEKKKKFDSKKKKIPELVFFFFYLPNGNYFCYFKYFRLNICG